MTIARRKLLAVFAGAPAWPIAARAQQVAKPPIIGYLAAGSKAGGARYYGGFRLGMRERGHIEARDYTFVDRYADLNSERLPALAEELVRLSPDVIVVTNTAAALATSARARTVTVDGQGGGRQHL